MNLPEKIERQIEYCPASGCWLWTGTLTGGYGQVGWGKTTQWAHRVVYELSKGGIPGGLEIDHLCRVRCCVNPDHLEPVTRQENMWRSPYYGSEYFCGYGHERTPENTYVYPDSRRECKTCRRERKRRNRAAARAARDDE